MVLVRKVPYRTFHNLSVRASRAPKPNPVELLFGAIIKCYPIRKDPQVIMLNAMSSDVK